MLEKASHSFMPISSIVVEFVIGASNRQGYVREEHGQEMEIVYDSRSKEYMIKICYLNWVYKILFTKITIFKRKDDTFPLLNSNLSHWIRL